MNGILLRHRANLLLLFFFSFHWVTFSLSCANSRPPSYRRLFSAQNWVVHVFPILRIAATTTKKLNLKSLYYFFVKVKEPLKWLQPFCLWKWRHFFTADHFEVKCHHLKIEVKKTNLTNNGTVWHSGLCLKYSHF